MFCVLPWMAIASPVSHTGNPDVVKGQLSTEFRIGSTADDENTRQNNRVFTRQHIDYGVTDHHAFRVGWNQQKLDNDSFQHTDFRLEHRFHFLKKELYGFDMGSRLIYVNNSGDSPDSARFRIMTQVDIAPSWVATNDIFFMHDVGEGAESRIAYDIRSQLMHRLDYRSNWIDSAQAGIEVFNNIGRLDTSYSEQFHSVGAIANIGFTNDMYIVTAYHRGISEAHPDDTFKLSLGRRF
jgi:hypothetical protein